MNIDSLDNKFQVSSAFVNNFFLEVLKVEKASKKKAKHNINKIEKKTRHLTLKTDDEGDERILGGAEQIQELEEPLVEIPSPTLKRATEPTLSKIILPLPPIPPLSPQKFSKPIAANIDLGQINPLISDPEITLIQCDGESTPLKINKRSKSEIAEIILNNEEIMDIIKRFAARAQIALTEPIFRCQVQGLAITAIISPYTGPRFVIVKR